ncbi:putative quinol monooxygenase [Edwardsiella tarda]|uniref:putative quinol monooxygenase n=1 Tax=Edwardsiella tarda TaxID=636 RepID=UPI003A869800
MAHDVPLGCAPDEYDDLISGTCSHLPKVSRQEPGCVRYFLYEDAMKSHVLVFQEQFVDQHAFDQHCKMPYFISLLNEIKGIVEKDPDIQFFKQVDPAA